MKNTMPEILKIMTSRAKLPLTGPGRVLKCTKKYCKIVTAREAVTMRKEHARMV